MREFSKSLINHAYTWYVNQKARANARLGAFCVAIQHQVSMCRTQVFLVELGRKHQREYLNAYLRRFHKIAMDCCDPMVEQC